MKKIALKNKVNNIKTKISNEVRVQLPIMQARYLKKIKGNHNFINQFIHVPDLINGGDADEIKARNRNAFDLTEYLSKGSIDYNLLSLSISKSMHLNLRYLFQDKESGLCSIAWLTETAEGWKVGKIEAYD